MPKLYEALSFNPEDFTLFHALKEGKGRDEEPQIIEGSCIWWAVVPSRGQSLQKPTRNDPWMNARRRRAERWDDDCMKQEAEL